MCHMYGCSYDVEDVEEFMENFLKYNREVDSVDFTFNKREICKDSNSIITTKISIHKVKFEADESDS